MRAVERPRSGRRAKAPRRAPDVAWLSTYGTGIRGAWCRSSPHSPTRLPGTPALSVPGEGRSKPGPCARTLTSLASGESSADNRARLRDRTLIRRQPARHDAVDGRRGLVGDVAEF